MSYADLINRAIDAVQDNPRHSANSLFELLCREFPDATDNQIDAAIEAALLR